MVALAGATPVSFRIARRLAQASTRVRSDWNVLGLDVVDGQLTVAKPEWTMVGRQGTDLRDRKHAAGQIVAECGLECCPYAYVHQGR